jgi:nicotinamide riboside kinase
MENDYPLVMTIVGAESSGKTVLAKQLADALSCVWVPEYSREYLENVARPYDFEDLEEIARGQWELMPILKNFPSGLLDVLPPSPIISPLPLSPLDSPLPPSPLNSPLPPSPLSPSLKGFGDQGKGESERYTIGSFSSMNSFVVYIKSLKREVIIVDSGMLTIRMWAKIKYGRTIPFVEEVMKNDPTNLYLLCRPRMEWERDPLREAPSLVDRAWIYNQYLNEMVLNNFEYTILST